MFSSDNSLALSRRTLLTGAALQSAVRAAEVLRLPRTVRVAIIGTEGHVGEITGPAKQNEAIKIVATSKDYPDYRKMLDVVKPDVVAVCNNNGERAAVILACIDRKLNVIAEKPLALTMEDLDRIQTGVKRTGVHLGMLLPMRYDPPYLALRQIVQQGLIGEVAQIAAQKSYIAGKREAWYLKRATYGGSIAWIGIHMIDLMRYTSGREFRKVTGMQAHIGFPELGEMENVTTSLFQLDNGGLATLRMDYLRTPSAPTHGDDRLRLAGTKGIAEYQEATGVTLMTVDQKPHRIEQLPAQGSVFLDYLNEVYNGKPSGLTLNDIYRVTELTIGAQEAADKGTVVQWER